MKKQTISRMNTLYRLAAVLLVVSLAACGGAKDEKGSLNDKKVQLQKLKTEQEKIAGDIQKLQEEIEKLDSNAAVKPRLVTVTTLATSKFEHFIDLQGRISTENIYNVSSRVGPMASSQIKAIYVKQGDAVRKGQLLLKLDDGLLRQQIEQAKLSLQGTKTTLDQAVEQAYINVLNAQAQLTAVESQWSTNQESFKITNEQLRLGAFNTIDLLTQKNLYVQALQAYVQARYSTILHKKIYEFYTGVPVAL